MKPLILVVEDDEITSSLIRFKLSNSGYDVVVVGDGTQALEFLKTRTPDLILLDMMMPMMSGKEFLLEFKKLPLGVKIPIIILTAKTLEKDVLEGLALGADDFMKKPFSPSELVARVQTVLARKK